MADNLAKPHLLSIVEHLLNHGVEFLVIGCQAAVLFGSPLPTFDVDLCYRRTPENLERLAQAFRELHPALRGAPPDMPWKPSLSRWEAISPSTPTLDHWTCLVGSNRWGAMKT
jgi:hypothetical protein